VKVDLFSLGRLRSIAASHDLRHKFDVSSWPVTASMANGRAAALWGKAAARSMRRRGCS
jgi:hypothetical protein